MVKGPIVGTCGGRLFLLPPAGEGGARAPDEGGPKRGWIDENEEGPGSGPSFLV